MSSICAHFKARLGRGLVQWLARLSRYPWMPVRCGFNTALNGSHCFIVHEMLPPPQCAVPVGSMNGYEHDEYKQTCMYQNVTLLN